MVYAQATVSKLTNYIKLLNIQNLWYFFKAVAFTRSNIDWLTLAKSADSKQPGLKRIKKLFLKNKGWAKWCPKIVLIEWITS